MTGAGGNLSVRLPGTDTCLVTAAGARLDELTAADFAVVGLDGTHRRGAVQSTEVALHLAAYRARPDVTAVAHLHPQLSVLLTTLGHPIRLLTTDHAYYVRSVSVTPYLPPGTAELAEAAAAALAAGGNCVVLGHHGCVVVADSVELAHARVANLEEAALATFRLLQLGDTTTACPPEFLDRIRAGEASA